MGKRHPRGSTGLVDQYLPLRILFGRDQASRRVEALHFIHEYVKLPQRIPIHMNALVNYLKQSDIFYQLTPTQLELVANLCQEVIFNAGDIIFQENSSSKELYVIAQGEVDILINRSGTGDL